MFLTKVVEKPETHILFEFDCFHPVVYTTNFITFYCLYTTINVSCKSYNLLVIRYMFRLLTAIIRLIQKDDAN